MNNTSLLDLTLPRTLDDWVARFEQSQWHGAAIEGWLYEGVGARRAAEQSLASGGVKAKLRSAYKPLLHYFLEELDCQALAAATITYPVHPQAAPRPFLLEACPLAGLLPDCKLEFVPGNDDLHYQLSLTLRNGEQRQGSAFFPHNTPLDPTRATPPPPPPPSRGD